MLTSSKISKYSDANVPPSPPICCIPRIKSCRGLLWPAVRILWLFQLDGIHTEGKINAPHCPGRGIPSFQEKRRDRKRLKVLFETHPSKVVQCGSCGHFFPLYNFLCPVLLHCDSACNKLHLYFRHPYRLLLVRVAPTWILLLQIVSKLWLTCCLCYISSIRPFDCNHLCSHEPQIAT